MNWLKTIMPKRFKESKPVKKEIPIYVKNIWGFLKDCQVTFSPFRMKELIKAANNHIKDDGYFQYNDKLEIEYKNYES